MKAIACKNMRTVQFFALCACSNTIPMRFFPLQQGKILKEKQSGFGTQFAYEFGNIRDDVAVYADGQN
ncbi:hypothetical protein D2Q93_08385 [Alicyclobacillaceae bacterium I2511]|nr:hypothetical protein D2Q93_08385 [Alicyclobacillaceae bacterium I2511]